MREEVEIFIFGQVQGVFFRSNVLEEAKKLGLSGWVSNESDGSVQVLAQGKKSDLQKLIDWCKIGTRFARVKEVRIKWREIKNNFNKFEIIL